MKIAICLRGQVRTGISASPSFLNYIGELLPYCDFFIHSWNITVRTKGDNSYLRDPEFNRNNSTFESHLQSTLLIDGEINQLTEIYNPKLIEVEDYVTFMETTEKEFGVIDALYSMWKVLQLKESYENKTNQKYDYVLSMRFDMLFNHQIKLKDTINCMLQRNVPFEDRPNIMSAGASDLVFVDANGCTLLNNYLNPKRKKTQSELANSDWSFLFMMFMLANYNMVSVGENKAPDDYIIILRPEVTNLNHITDFEKIKQFTHDHNGGYR